MNINIKSFAHLRLALGKSPMTMEIADGATVADLLALLGNHYGEAAQTAIWMKDGQTLKVTPVIDGKVAALQDAIQDGATVVFMSNVAGGVLS
jgi:molybdopterin converting factor small subunit